MPRAVAQADLWVLTLDNDDKHNLILPTVSLANVSNLSGVMGGVLAQHCSVGGDASRPIRLFGSGQPFQLDGHHDVSVGVEFGGNSDLSGRPAVETLKEVHGLLVSVIDRFEELIAQRL